MLRRIIWSNTPKYAVAPTPSRPRRDSRLFTCKICGKAFGGAAKNAVYCSQECSDEGRRRIHTSSRHRNGVGTSAGYVSKNAKVDSYLRIRNVREEWK